MSLTDFISGYTMLHWPYKNNCWFLIKPFVGVAFIWIVYMLLKVFVTIKGTLLNNKNFRYLLT